MATITRRDNEKDPAMGSFSRDCLRRVLWKDLEHAGAADRAVALHRWACTAAFRWHCNLLRVFHFALLFALNAVTDDRFGHSIEH